jgi:cellulose synthase/poly-beta-1,6-N-acetylglucosamine synthase-like glycosyltransferase
MLVHWSRPLGSARLGLGATIKGSGMALRWSALKGQFGAYGLAEDAELTLELCRKGVRVEFEPRAVVRGAMAATYEAAKTQDRRWESGRLSLLPRALREAVRSLARGRLDLAAAAFEIASFPLTLLLALGALGVAMAWMGYGSLPFVAVGLASLGAYVAMGMVAARPSWHDMASLVAVPRFLVHKLAVLAELALRGAPTTWQRTDRK